MYGVTLHSIRTPILHDMTSQCCRDKAVVVVVYAEKPQGHRHRRQHRNVSRNNGSRGRGYNRRAELLHYARHLREPARPVSQHPTPHINHHPTTQVSGGDRTRKQTRSSPPTCFGKWRFVVTRFLRSTKEKEKGNHNNKVPKTTKMKALVKSLQVKKKGSFLSKLLAAMHKRR